MPSADAHAHSEHSQHRNKRPFQPSINHFFFREGEFEDSDSDEERGPGPITRSQQHHASRRRQHQQHLHQQQRDSGLASVPGSVQADLLSVGMRVRKSVPEGYKTHKTVALPSIQTTLTSPRAAASIATSTSSTTTTAAAEYSVKPPRDSVTDAQLHQRELLPFCGLHKIGGYAEQPVTNVHLYAGADATTGERALNIFPLPAEAFSQPFSSQSSTDSSISNSSLRPNPANTTNNKRSWQDEDDKPVRLNSDLFFKMPMKVSEDEVPVSPLSETPPQSINAFPPLRPFAQPKTRRPGTARAMDVDGMIVKESDIDMDLENAEQGEGGRVLVGSSSDFGEAEFLRPWGPGREVDMGGV